MNPFKDRSRFRWICRSLVIVVLLSVPSLVEAMVEKLSFSQIVRNSDQICVASVIALDSHWNETETLIVTDVTLEIQDALKGGQSSCKEVLEFPGGQVGDLRLEVSDIPTFEIGEQVVLFLKNDGLPVVGGTQGKFTIENDIVQGIEVPVGEFHKRVKEIVSEQQAGIESDFDWEDGMQGSIMPTEETPSPFPDVIPTIAPNDIATNTLESSPNSVLDTQQTGSDQLSAIEGQQSTIPEAAPQITSISPNSGPARGARGVCAPDTTQVEINGSNFGSSQGTGRVRFRRDSGTTYDGCIQTWSNTRIVARVPGGVSSNNVQVITSGGTSNGVQFVVTYSYGGVKWNTNTVGFRVNPNTNDVTGEEVAVQAAATTWNNVANGNFSFRYDGTTTKSGAAGDNENVISWGSTSGSVATNYSWISGGQLVEFDIVFEDNYLWGTDGSAQRYDIQHTATHELGHSLLLLDLYGTADTAKTMYGYTGAGQTQQRTLEADDIAGMRYVYPCSPPSNGITLYEHPNYTGRCATFVNSDPELGDNGFSDVASSIQFRGAFGNTVRASVYEHSNYGGVVSSFLSNDSDFGNDAIGHDRASSIRLAAVCPSISAWKGEYWTNRTLSGDPLLCRNDSAVNFNWGTGSPAGIIPSDSFSARWTRSLSLSAGNYRFYVRSDDGVRLWIDGVLVIDKWIDQGPTQYSVDRVMSAGSHSFKIEYYENSSGAVAQFWYEQINAVCPSISAWKGEYWNNRNLSGPTILCRNDSNVNFNWGTGGPGSGVPNDNFSARWTRTMSFNAGRYRFHLRGDDGIRLWIDGVLVIDAWRDQGATEYTTLRNLTAGNHSLRVEYYEGGGNAVVQLWWELENLAAGRPAWATSQQSSGYAPSMGNDRNTSTRWSSGWSATHRDDWWRVDLGTGQTYDRVVIRWEAAYAVDHFVGWSNDGTNFTGNWYSVSAAGNYAYNIGSRTARYVAVLSRRHAPCCGNYSFWEFEVYRTAVTASLGTQDEETLVGISDLISGTTTITPSVLLETRPGVIMPVDSADVLYDTIMLEPYGELETIQVQQ